MAAHAFPLEVATLVVDNISTLRDLNAIARGADGTAFAVAASERINALRDKYENVTLSRSNRWRRLDLPEHAEFTRIISIPRHVGDACGYLRHFSTPPKLQALRVWFKEQDYALREADPSRLGNLKRVLVSGLSQLDERSDDEEDGNDEDKSDADSEDQSDADSEDQNDAGSEDHNDTGSEDHNDAGSEDHNDTGSEDHNDTGSEDLSYYEPDVSSFVGHYFDVCQASRNFSCATGVIRGLTTGSNSFKAAWVDSSCPVQFAAKTTSMAVVIEPSPYSTDWTGPVRSLWYYFAREESIDSAKEIAGALMALVRGKVTPLTLIFLSKGPDVSWIPESASSVCSSPATWDANEHLLLQYVEAAARMLVTCAVFDPSLPEFIAIVNARAMLGAGGRPAAEVEAALDRVKAVFELDRIKTAFDAAVERRWGSTGTVGGPYDDPAGIQARLKWLSMDEYLAQPGWDLALDADEVAPWLEAK